jgi:aminopeptidase N
LLSLLEAVPADAEPEVVMAVADKFQSLDQLCDGLPLQGRLRTFARTVLHRFFDRLGWDSTAGESGNTALARDGVIDALARMEDPAIAAEAHRRFAQYLSEPDRLDAELRHLILDAVAFNADATSWRQIHELARSARSELERHELYRLLATAADPRLVRQALALALSGEPPATSVQKIVETAAQRHPRQAFEFATAHWPQLQETIDPDYRVRFVPMLLDTAADAGQIGPLEAFARQHIPLDARRDVDKTEASLRYQSRVRRDRLPEVDRWLRLQAAAHS